LAVLVKDANERFEAMQGPWWKRMLVTVLLVDDHPLVLDALRQAVDRTGAFEVHTAISLSEGREAVRLLEPAVIVCDVRLPDGSGLRLIEEAKAVNTRTACLVLSSFATAQYVTTARRLGAAGYLLKTEPTDTIIAAIRTVAAGGTVFGSFPSVGQELALTPREREVVAAVVSGQTNDEIAGHLGITRKGVEAHLSRLYERTGAASRTELAVRAEREAWLDGP
jgi:DNA-binding NarL/FixJ family response regulator